MTRPRLLLSWSSGKDSAWTLHRLRAQDRYDIVGLVTTVNERYGRVAMHAVRDEMLAAGLRAVITCIDPARLPRTSAGGAYDATFLANLPAGVDPCGENGEFHTFCHAGPMFARPLAVRTGEIVERERFVYADVLPA